MPFYISISANLRNADPTSWRNKSITYTECMNTKKTSPRSSRLLLSLKHFNKINWTIKIYLQKRALVCILEKTFIFLNKKWYTHTLKKKNPKWNKTSVDDHDLTARALFMEDNTDEELWFWQQTIVKYNTTTILVLYTHTLQQASLLAAFYQVEPPNGSFLILNLVCPRSHHQTSLHKIPVR